MKMKTVGIVAEYNPFHNGHEYHITQSRCLTGADYVVVVMSGNFVQRGAPALTDKYTRAHMALLGGADLVLELPVLFSTGSAGDFASAAVSLLDKLGVVDFLCFGSETEDTDIFLQAAKLLAKEPPVYSSIIKDEVKQGLSFAKARAKALAACLQKEFPQGPNNLLGLEYCTALSKRNSPMQPVPLLRKGVGYHATALPPSHENQPVYASAQSIRNLIQNTPDRLSLLPALSPYLPLSQHKFWQTLLSQNRFLFAQDFTKELRCRLLMESPQTLERYADVNRMLADKLAHYTTDFLDWPDLCIRLKSKDLTYSRISRSLCHILLNLSAMQLQQAREQDFCPYARILGFRRRAKPLLASIKKKASLPFISKLADAKNILSPSALTLLQQDIAAAHLYESAMSANCSLPPVNEYRRQLLIL